MAMEAVVLFDYEKQLDDEVNLIIGEVITDVIIVDEGWYEGTVNGDRGMFPNNYVQIRPASGGKPPAPAPVPMGGTTNDLGTPPLRDMKNKSRRAKVTFSYAAENTDELTLLPGQLLVVIAEEEKGWWRGRSDDGKEGLFPSNFVEELASDNHDGGVGARAEVIENIPREEKPEAPEPARQSVLGLGLKLPVFNPAATKANLRKTVPPPHPTGQNALHLSPWQEELQKRRSRKGSSDNFSLRQAELQKTRARKGHTPRPAVITVVKPPPAGFTAIEKPPEKPVERAKVTFDYVAEQPDELSIKVGDVVEILRKDQEGWWEVCLGENTGMIPDNFVDLLPAQQISTLSRQPPTPSTSKPEASPPSKPSSKEPHPTGQKASNLCPWQERPQKRRSRKGSLPLQAKNVSFRQAELQWRRSWKGHTPQPAVKTVVKPPPVGSTAIGNALYAHAPIPQALQPVQREPKFYERRSQQATATSDKQQLQQQVASQLNTSIQCSYHSEFWEVQRDDITLNMHKFLGTGAWGYVVEGQFRGQTVAVKCLHDLIRQPEVTSLIRQEISIMAQLRHPNLVLFIAAVLDEESDPLIITELLDVSLRKAYEKHMLVDMRSKLRIYRDIACALNYLHLHHHGAIIHRDVSSANVLLEGKPNNQWKAKLSDFGSAKLAAEACTLGPGAMVYAAPEVRERSGTQQTPKVDVYSYGVMLCEITVEEFPTERRYVSMVEAIKDSWPNIFHLITSCTRKRPGNRPTMANILTELDKLRL